MGDSKSQSKKQSSLCAVLARAKAMPATLHRLSFNPFMQSWADMPFDEALQLAYQIAGKPTYKVLAQRLSVSTTAVTRWFTDPTYNPSPLHLPALCRVLGNNILIEWLAAQIHGHLVIRPESDDSGAIHKLVADVTRETADVLEAHGEAMADANMTRAERRALKKQVDELAARAMSLSEALED